MGMKKSYVSHLSGVFMFFFYLLCMVLTFKMGDDEKQTLTINIIVLTVMLIMVLFAELISFKKMKNSTKDLLALKEKIQRWSENTVYVNWNSMLRTDELKSHAFKDRELEKAWKHCTQNNLLPDEQEIFDPVDILNRYHADLCDLIPGILTAMGILGTFIGLILSLSGFDNTIQGENLTGLVGSMNVAFYTSVYGISFSILFNLLNHFIQNNLQEVIGEINVLLSVIYGRKSKSYVDPSISALQSAQTIFAENMGNLSNALNKNVQDIQTIHKESEKVISDFDKYISHLNQATSKADEAYLRMEKYANSLKAAAETNAKNLENMKTYQQTMLSALSNVTDQSKTLDQQIAVLSDSEKKINSFYNMIVENNAKISESITLLLGIEQAERDERKALYQLVLEQASSTNLATNEIKSLVDEMKKRDKSNSNNHRFHVNGGHEAPVNLESLRQEDFLSLMQKQIDTMDHIYRSLLTLEEERKQSFIWRLTHRRTAKRARRR